MTDDPYRRLIDSFSETNEILDDMAFIDVETDKSTARTSLPEAEWLQLQGINSMWHVSWGKSRIETTRWGRFKHRWRRRRERLVEAYKVYTGELEARDPYDW